MTGSASRIVFFVLCLVVGAAAEELSPKILGVGFPALLALVQVAALRRSLRAAVLVAIAAGALEESLSGLVPMTGVCYFLAVALAARKVGSPVLMTLLTYPLFQVWLAVWMPGMGGGVFNRIVLAVPVGLVTAAVAVPVADWLGRKAAVDARS